MHAASKADRGRRTLVRPREGDIVAGKYLIVRVLGEGGMGIVYEAMHQRLRQRVAIKMLLPMMLEHDVIVARFEREARAAAQLRGRHIARVNDVDTTPDGLPYMVMDFLEGRDLQLEMEARGLLPASEAVDYVLQACAAMVEAHQLGIVHRDLKPSNLFLEVDGGRRIVRVLDFGISKVSPSAEAVEGKLTDVDTIVGTAMYMSPEQVRGSDAIDGRADIWSLGVILYEALAGRVPWVGAPHSIAAAIVSEDAPDLRSLCSVASDLSAIVHKTLERNPNNRFANVKELATALAPFAPAGSFGRAFADHVVAAGTHPRVSITPASSDSARSGSLAPAKAVTGGDDKTFIDTPDSRAGGVNGGVGTAPGWSQPPPGLVDPESNGGKGRAALVGILVAFVIGLVSIGSVVLFIRPRMNARTNETAAAPIPSSSVALPASQQLSPSSSASSVVVSPMTTSSITVSPPPALTTVTTSSSKPVRPSAPLVVKPATTGTAATPPTSSDKPAAPVMSAAPDKPLFL